MGEGSDPHGGERLFEGGAALERARVGMVLVHGRGANAHSILDFGDNLAQPEAAFRAPQAGGNSWYPHSFLAPISANEPGISSGLRSIDRAIGALEQGGLPTDRIVLMGFSQGACLAAEYAARSVRRLGGIACLSGGLIGTADRSDASPPDDKYFDYQGDLVETPTLFACHARDPHIPLVRVEQSIEIFRRLGGAVDARIEPGFGHQVTEAGVAWLRRLLSSFSADAPPLPFRG